jgi:hypothetical protein
MVEQQAKAATEAAAAAAAAVSIGTQLSFSLP